MEDKLTKKLLTAFSLLILFATSMQAQVLWNLKGELMPIKDDYYDKTKLSWQAGLELEIPIKSEWNIETGLLFGQKYSKAEYVSEQWMLKLPVRLAYKKTLANKLELHMGAGPFYASDFEYYRAVGIQPAVALYWHNFNIGATYDIPIYSEHFDEIRSKFMVTLGIRFKSKVWKHIGVGLATAAVVGAAVAGATQQVSDNSTTEYLQGSGDSGSVEGSDTKSSTKNSQSKSASVTDVRNLDRAYSGYEDQLIRMSNRKYKGDELRQKREEARSIQAKMREIRQKIKNLNGHTRAASSWESWVPEEAK